MSVHEMVMAQSAYVDATIKYVHRVVKASAPSTLLSSSSTADSRTSSPNTPINREWWIENYENILSSHRVVSDGTVKPFVYVDGSDVNDEIGSGTILSSQDFVTSLLKLNRLVYTRHNSAEERRRMLFGVDQITP